MTEAVFLFIELERGFAAAFADPSRPRNRYSEFQAPFHG
jgi:hypothetical protein